MEIKTATTTEEQIAKLENRGMVILDRAKAEEILSDIGYYRLGFYWFPVAFSASLSRSILYNVDNTL